jgi:hypothetical protein
MKLLEYQLTAESLYAFKNQLSSQIKSVYKLK